MRVLGPNVFASPEQIVCKSLSLSSADRHGSVGVAGPDSLEAMVSLCRDGFEHVECARQATSACADEASEPVFQLTRVTWRAEPDRHTIPHPSGRHLFDPMLDRLGRAREPSCRVAPDLMAVIARRDIALGEPLTVREPVEH